MSISGGMAGLRIQERVRTPFSVALEAKLALALCLPPMGAVNQFISKRGTIMNSKRRAIVKLVAGMTARIFEIVGTTVLESDHRS